MLVKRRQRGSIPPEGETLLYPSTLRSAEDAARSTSKVGMGVKVSFIFYPGSKTRISISWRLVLNQQVSRRCLGPAPRSEVRNRAFAQGFGKAQR